MSDFNPLYEIEISGSAMFDGKKVRLYSEQEYNQIVAERDHYLSMCDNYVEENQRISDERDALNRDAERLDWLEQDDGRFYNIDRISATVGKGFRRTGHSPSFMTIRQVIDAAMGDSDE